MSAIKNRIDKKLFSEIFKKGKSVFSERLLLKFVFAPNKEPAFSFVVSSKTIKRAVDRNKLKRRARHVVRKVAKEIKEGTRAVVFFKKWERGIGFSETETELIKIFKKAGILR